MKSVSQYFKDMAIYEQKDVDGTVLDFMKDWKDQGQDQTPMVTWALTRFKDEKINHNKCEMVLYAYGKADIDKRSQLNKRGTGNRVFVNKKFLDPYTIWVKSVKKAWEEHALDKNLTGEINETVIVRAYCTTRKPYMEKMILGAKGEKLLASLALPFVLETVDLRNCLRAQILQVEQMINAKKNNSIYNYKTAKYRWAMSLYCVSDVPNPKSAELSEEDVKDFTGLFLGLAGLLNVDIGAEHLDLQALQGLCSKRFRDMFLPFKSSNTTVLKVNKNVYDDLKKQFYTPKYGI